MMFDTHAYYGQPTVVPLPVVPQGLFGTLPGQFGPLAAPVIPGVLGHQVACQFGGMIGRLPFEAGLTTLAPTALAPHGVFPSVPGPYWQPVGQAIGGWPAGIGGWPGHPLVTGIPPLGLFGALPQYAQPIGTIGSWPGQLPLGGSVGRSFLPYQVVSPQMAYAG